MARYVSGYAVGLVDSETGELFDVALPGDQVRIVRKDSIVAFRQLVEQSVSINGGRAFVKQFPDITDRLCRELSPAELWVLHMLIPYVGVNSGILRTADGSFATRAFFIGRCNGKMSVSLLDKSLAGLCAKGVLAKCYIKNKKCYIMNPYVCHRGSKANETLLELFKHSGWGVTD